ncbi:MAG: glucosaminidase domain-containing protein [Bacteroidia bacterium]
MKNYLLILALLLPSLMANGQARKYTTEEYIKIYKDLAISEMMRTGIPASIKLAQGVLESGSGNSELSLKSNNHFGIKCKSHWTGRKTYYDDDEKGECFRVYNKVEDSYRDHSDFLSVNTRYAFLFEFDKTDYKAWAKGLKKAGYATNPRYPELLIGIIEKYDLPQYDLIALGRKLPVADNENSDGISITQTLVFNGIPAGRVLPGENMRTFGERHDMREWQVRKYNDLEKNANIISGSILYLKPKRGRPAHKQHSVQAQETMHYISQLHGIRLKKLLRKNRMAEGQEPAVGETISLRKKVKQPPKLTNPDLIKEKKYVGLENAVDENGSKPDKKQKPPKDQKKRKPEETPVKEVPRPERPKPEETTAKVETEEFKAVKEEEITIAEEPQPAELVIPEPDNRNDKPATVPKETELTVEPEPAPEEKAAPATAEQTPQADPQTDTAGWKMHTVQQGESLYSISRQYDISVAELREINMIVGNDLKMGQQLKVQLPAPAPEPVYHVVEQGETLYAISRRFEVSMGTLMDLNDLSGFDISVGQKLRIK